MPVVVGEPGRNQNVAPVSLSHRQCLEESLAVPVGQQDYGCLDALVAFDAAARLCGHGVGEQTEDRLDLVRSETSANPCLQTVADHRRQYAVPGLPQTIRHIASVNHRVGGSGMTA